jgi:NitT/TauT family transport system permease protein
VARLTALASFLVIWQLAQPLFASSLIPTPAQVAEEMVELLMSGAVFEHFILSLGRLAVGYAIALLLGTAIGVVIGLSRFAEIVTRDFLVISLTFPHLIWALLVAMWVGYGSQGPIIVAVLCALPYILINVAAGVRDVPRDLLDMARAYGVPTKDKVRQVILPSLAPFFFASLRYGLSAAWKGLIVAEVFAAQSGAGFHMVTIRRSANLPGIVGWGAFFVILAIVLERIVFGRLSARFFKWRPEQKTTAAPMQSASQSL